MKKRIALKRSVPSFVMFATIFVAVTIPLVVMKLSGEETFDIRKQAYETESPTTTNPCVIYLPKVNPKTLEVNGNYKVSIEAISSVKDIEGITIVDTNGNTLFEKEYTSLVNSVEETFTYSPSKTGDGFIRGSLKKVTGEESCSDSLITVINENTAPEITSEEKDADISVGDSFEYTILAEDLDRDIVNFAYSFTPRADWLKKVVIEDGSSGTVKIKLQGTPDKPASYLAHIFVHDGYGNHLNSMAWIISVNQDENDIPVVKILTPSQIISANVGDSIPTKWLASDQNQIVQYQIYMSQDPTDSDTWETIDQNISYKTREYNVNTSGLSGGTYRLIVRAIDNQDPEGIGLAVSPEITLLGDIIEGEKEEEISDDIVLIKPQIINVTPNNSAEVENTKPIIRATLIAGINATIDEESIVFSINNKEITEGIRLNEISNRETTFIYQPPENLTAGRQKLGLSFKDTNDNLVEKEWTFTLIDTTPVVNPDTFIIFGIEVSKKIGLILGSGIIVVLLAILIPIIIYKMWSPNSKDYSKIANKELPPKIPSSKGMYKLESNINIPSQAENSTEEETTKTESNFSTPSLEDLNKEEGETTEPEKNTPLTKTAPIPNLTNEKASTAITQEKDKWKPKVTTPSPAISTVATTPLEETSPTEAEETTQKSESEIPTSQKDPFKNVQPLPDLAIPTPETFVQQPSPSMDIPVNKPETDKTMDDISQLYKEIQKVENQEDTNQPQNS